MAQGDVRQAHLERVRAFNRLVAERIGALSDGFSARFYLGHLGRFGVWLHKHYSADLVAATSHDLREYGALIAERQKPASQMLLRRLSDVGELSCVPSVPYAREV
jgi:hypothetical protein